MSLRTIKNKEIIIPAIEGYGFHRHQNLTKAIIAKMLEYFFSNKTKTFTKVFSDLDSYVVDASTPDLYIFKAFPYTERKVPALIINVGDAEEVPYCVGADNSIALSKQGVGTYIELFTSGAKLPVVVGVISESPDITADLAALVQSCFSLVFKWQYMFLGDDLSSFSITPVTTKIKIGNSFEAEDTENKVIYGCTVSFVSMTQAVFTDNSEVSRYVLAQNFDIDPKSGISDI